MQTSTADLPEDLTFEAAMAGLEQLVKQLESGKIPLDSAIEAYERGHRLRQFCEAKLAEAKGKIDQIVLNADGTHETKVFDAG